MKKIAIIISLLFIFKIVNAGTYVVLNASNTGTVVATGKITIDRINIVNPGSDTLWIHCYDKATAATSINIPFFSIECPPNSNKCALPNYAPTPDAISGLSIRAVKRNGSSTPLTSIISSTVSASYYPLIQVKVH